MVYLTNICYHISYCPFKCHTHLFIYTRLLVSLLQHIDHDCLKMFFFVLSTQRTRVITTTFSLPVFVTYNVLYLYWKLAFYLLLFCTKFLLFVFFKTKLHAILYLNVIVNPFIIFIID